ncbi:HAD-IIA family hydrolase [Geodermatophilus sp. CPCC 206100]|uniref:HAD-IIA family hydrolase n=1 Tax=Geodermatophilus sp. CPCC 206100 TaxID=3020054 RepID=UPI003B005346
MPDLDTGALERLRRVRGFVLDMDGTLVLGDRNNRGLRALPGAVEFVRLLAERDLRFCVFTNGTVKTPRQCADALQQAGFPVPDDAVLTPATAAAEVFRRRGHRRVMVLGGKGITEPLEAAGIETLPPVRGATADAVFAGWYRQELTFEALEAACFAVFEGARFYSASQSLFFATAEGRTLGTSRAISAVVRDITRARVTVVGKPALQALQAAARHLSVPAAEVAVVGDDPELEVPMAHKGGALAVAVHTGIGHAESFTDLPEDVRPHLDLPDVGVLADLLR